jgi:hypothetical protein
MHLCPPFQESPSSCPVFRPDKNSSKDLQASSFIDKNGSGSGWREAEESKR